jgi:hypothetical protein
MRILIAQELPFKPPDLIDGGWSFEMMNQHKFIIDRADGRHYYADGINEGLNFIMEAERGMAIENGHALFAVHKAKFAGKNLLLTVPFEYQPPRKKKPVQLFSLVKALLQEMNETISIVLIGYEETDPTCIEIALF